MYRNGFSIDSPTSVCEAKCMMASGLCCSHHRVHRRTVRQVTLDKRCLRVHGLPVALVQVVKDDDLFAGLDQLLDGDAADIACPACH